MTLVDREITRQLNVTEVRRERLVKSERIEAVFAANSTENLFEKWINQKTNPDKITILEYWESQKLIYKNLFKIAKKYLLIQPTSASVERQFSMSKDILKSNRLKLLTCNVEKTAMIIGNKEMSKQIILKSFESKPRFQKNKMINNYQHKEIKN